MPHTLLLADDSVTIQRVIELTFADEDIQVIAVGDGQQAIDRIETDRPDIVLADVGMPERDGYEVAAFVKNTPHLAHIPVLLLTGAFEPVDEQRAAAVGCDGVLAKPFEPHMVITRVKELLAGGPEARVPAEAPAGAAEAAPQAAGLLSAAGEPEASAPVESVAEVRADRSAITEEARPPVAAREETTPVRLRRRTPIAVPGFGAPPQPSESQVAALDDYFDRLDAAFATLQPPPAQGAGASAAAELPAAAAAETAGQAAADAPPTPALRPTPPVGGIAQAFAALFAAERGETAADGPAFIGPAAMPQHAVDDLAERVTRQVLERLSDRVVRETVADVVSRVAERLVRDEIERVKATLK
ncbi:MAG: response regulator [Vicinamibacterales bacterium]